MYHKEHSDIHDKALSQQWQFEALKKPTNEKKDNFNQLNGDNNILQIELI